MLLIACPFCGPRPEIEFRHGGEAHVARAADPGAVDDHAWSEHLFVRKNPRGLHAESWCHQHGCQRWFNAIRDTYTDGFVETYRAGGMPVSGGAPPPPPSGRSPSPAARVRNQVEPGVPHPLAVEGDHAQHGGGGPPAP